VVLNTLILAGFFLFGVWIIMWPRVFASLLDGLNRWPPRLQTPDPGGPRKVVLDGVRVSGVFFAVIALVGLLGQLLGV
jgi:hypothetical protein